METILANPAALTVLPPLAAGLAIGVLAWVTNGNRIVTAIAWAVGVLFVYWLLEGVPPVPAVAAKQKLATLLALGAIVGIVRSIRPSLQRWVVILVMAVLAIRALTWLGASKLQDPDALSVVIVAGALAVLLAIGFIGAVLTDASAADANHAERPFMTPAVLLTTATGGAIIATWGLFMGMAQMLGAFAATLGGALAVSYLALALRGRGLDLMRSGGAMIAGNAVMCTLVLTALLAPSANPVALLVLAAGPLLAVLLTGPLGAILPPLRFLRPILAGAIIAIPAIIASLIAVVYGTSPFA